VSGRPHVAVPFLSRAPPTSGVKVRGSALRLAMTLIRGWRMRGEAVA
jgi:hypothetical protein